MTIIGGGLGGLTAGALLSRAGMKVVVIERESRPGGYLAGFHRKAFVFDSALHWLNQCGRGGMVNKVFAAIGDDSPRALPMERIRRYKGDSFDYLLTSNPEELKARLQADFPEDQKGLDKFFRQAWTLGQRMVTYGKFMRAAETMNPVELAARGLSLAAWSYPFWRHVGDKDCAGLGSFFQSERLKNVFCSEENILSCLVPIGWAYHGDFQRPPAGGSQSFVKWLKKKVEAQGSVVALRTEVKQIDVDQRRATGVTLADGHAIKSRWVIGACDIEAMFTRLLPTDAVPKDVVDKYRQAELYNSCVTISLGLDCHPRELGMNEELVYLTRDGLARHAHNSGDPHTTAISVLAPSLRDPTLAPEGKGTLTMYAEAGIDYGDQWKTEPGMVRGAAYKEFKRQYAEVLLDRVQDVLLPGFKKHIELIDIATPVTHLRYTGNKGGTIMAQRTSKKNMQMKVSGYKTPVDRLIIGGHWAEYGGGVPVTVKAGANAAAIILKRESPAKFKELCGVLDNNV